MERGQGFMDLENTDWTGNGKNYFLGIGIDDYLHWDHLNNAVKDVNDFISVLTTQYQFESAEIHTLFNNQATEGNIYNKIRELKRVIHPEDNLIVYYSGHGHYDEEFEEGYWIPVDAQSGSEDRYISNANIIKRINAIDTHHTLMIVDSCFSGTLVVKKRSGLTDERFKSRRILASGRQETVADGQAGENSPFAAGIITYLKKNTEKAINTTVLVQYVKDYVETRSRQTPVEGRIQNSADEGGEFVFHLKLDEEHLWENVRHEDTVDAYSNYLDYYPSGLFANQANRRILELKEDDIWHSARIKDSELAYENYLKKYAPKGKYIDEANACLKKLQTAHEARRAALDEMSKRAKSGITSGHNMTA
ncbi:MAG: caspase family protein [Lewinella sp.]|nr:caspase family protein [Lewinella sp.]